MCRRIPERLSSDGSLIRRGTAINIAPDGRTGLDRRRRDHRLRGCSNAVGNRSMSAFMNATVPENHLDVSFTAPQQSEKHAFSREENFPHVRFQQTPVPLGSDPRPVIEVLKMTSPRAFIPGFRSEVHLVIACAFGMFHREGDHLGLRFANQGIRTQRKLRPAAAGDQHEHAETTERHRLHSRRRLVSATVASAENGVENRMNAGK